MKDYFFLALNNLRKRGLRSWLTMLGIFIGIAAVVSLISLGQGLENAVIGQFGALETDVLTIENQGTGFGPPGSTAPKKLTDEDLKIIELVQGVKLAIPRLIRTAKIEFDKKASFDFIGSIPDEEEKINEVHEFLNADIKEGRLLKENDRKKVVVGNDFVDKFGKQIRAGNELKINGESFEVMGILERSGSFIVNSAILIPEEDMKEILNIGNEIDIIAVRVEDEDRIDDIAREIERKLRKERNQDVGEEDFAVQTPLQSLKAVSTILNIVNLIVSGIAAISLLIGGIGIANTMFTSVLERTKEIGIMKAVGAKNKDILSIFLFESALLGLAGGIIGSFLGLSLAFVISSATSSFLGTGLQVTLSIPLLGSAILLSLSIGIVSGIIPSFQASKLNPSEALRK